MEGNKWTMELDIQADQKEDRKQPAVVVNIFNKDTGEIRQKRFTLQKFYQMLNYSHIRNLKKRGEEIPEIVGVCFVGGESYMEVDDNEERH